MRYNLNKSLMKHETEKKCYSYNVHMIEYRELKTRITKSFYDKI